MNRAKTLAFLRVLIAAAWADGEMSYEELNNLKAYFRELDLDNDAITALEPYLADPIDEGEAHTIIEDFLAEARGSERSTMLAAVRDMLLADGVLAPSEEEFLSMLDRAEQIAPTAGVFVAQLKRLWGRSRPPAAAESGFRRSDLVDEFVRNRVLYQVKRKLQVASGGQALDADTERVLRYVCSVGALLGHVAGVDRVFDADERATIAEQLESISDLQPSDVDIIVEIVESEVLSDVGYQPFVRELDQLVTPETKEKILTFLFEVAAADGEISFEEEEEIHKIAKAMAIDQESFIRAKLATRPSG